MAAWGLAVSGAARVALTPFTLGFVLFVIGFVVAFAVATYVLSHRVRRSAGAE